MPSYPRIDKGEGFVRTHDLIEELKTDVGLAYKFLEEDRESQYLRRCVVRAIFSFIEACIECLKVEVRATVRCGDCSLDLTGKEKETLGALHLIGDRRGDKLLPLDENLKRTFRLAAKVWGLNDYSLSTGTKPFEEFQRARDARNRLTHPRTFYDIQVTDQDMHDHSSAYHWVLTEFGRLFRMRIEAVIASVPESDRAQLSKLVMAGDVRDDE